MTTLELTPEDFSRYEYEINHVQAEEIEQEEAVVNDFLEFIRDCDTQKRLPF